MLEVLIEIWEMKSHGDHKCGQPGGRKDKTSAVYGAVIYVI